MALMAKDYQHTFQDLDKRAMAPEYNLNQIYQNLDSLPDPLAAVLRVVEARNKREAEEQQRREANRRLQEQLARKHDELAQKDLADAAAEEQMQDANLPAVVPEEVKEPEVMEALCLVPSQPLPVVDLSPLGLPVSISRGEALAMLQQLMITGQLFAYVGAFDGQSAGPVLKVLFHIVAFDENPFSAYQQLMRYYNEADREDMGWVPTLQDFFTSLTTLGYQPPKGHGAAGGGSRKRSSTSPRGESAGGGSSSSGSGGGGEISLSRLFNLQGLLRLLADLTRLHLQGRVDLGFGNQDQATGKGLITALLRFLLDPRLSAVMHADVCTALELLMQPWDDTLWRRICDETALTAAEAGPSHRAAYRVVTAVQGLSERLRTWQQHAAMQLLRRTLPQGLAGGSGSAGSHRGQVGVDIRQVQALLGKASPAAVRTLLSGMGRSARDRGTSGAAAAGVDYWRLLTVLQCAHLVVWTAVHITEGEEEEEMVRWIAAYFKYVEQSLRGQQPTVMRIKVFLADALTNYDMLGSNDLLVETKE
ncbi:hypothetical protein VaNZ11_013773 [Volvox africanus]|uniref:Uncharacterized protein n=1 Tax=Volvox africanus TaxID=51714 RepID=A0ABQ5SJ24_9CHLO|nr:hypothetical protein VaNZ11_013773 [Volvox africanus]